LRLDGVLEPHVRSARLYDAVHEAEGKDYAREAGAVLALVRSRVPDAASLLDVACGTGRHLEHFAAHLRCTGLDVDEGMLAVARDRCPEVPLVQGDMVDFELGARFDAVTCLFSAIGYTLTSDRLDRAVSAMARHLRPGGVLIVEPWFQPEQWEEGYLSMSSVSGPDLKVARMSLSERREQVAVMDFHYLVGTADGVESFVEHHELALFTWAQYRAAFARAGLEPEVDHAGLIGRGLVVGEAPP
jgi:ubiquinone/menaquinone biosynthesis C-methylase UbiE